MSLVDLFWEQEHCLMFGGNDHDPQDSTQFGTVLRVEGVCNTPYSRMLRQIVFNRAPLLSIVSFSPTETF